VTGNGAGETIALIDAYNDPDIISDANAFSAQFGLEQFNGSGEPTLQVLNQTGGTALPANSPTPGQWDVEESLDVEWAHAIAPGANIILYEANSSATADLYTAVSTAAATPGVAVVSMSFGTPQLDDFYSSGGDPELGDDSIFTTPTGHQGVTFVASTGDAGAANVGYPALSPNVVAVGGTTLTIASDGTYLGESAWSGGGGGYSIEEAQPSYQSASINTTGARATPDVSMDADPESGVYVLDSYDGGYNQIGGTS
jgi:subtilase family serine protease